MLKNRALLAILGVVTVAAALATWWLCGATTSPPLPGIGTQTSASTHTDPATTVGNGTLTTVPSSDDLPAIGGPRFEPIRVAVDASASTDRRPCRLEIAVVAEHLGRRTPVAYTEVAAILTDLDLATPIARTGADGISELSFAGGHGFSVRCLAGIGGVQETMLQADTTVRATIIVQPKVFATGRVIDPSNVGVAGADVMLLRLAPTKHSAGSMWRIGRSSPDGSFRIPVGVDGQICAHHDNYVSSAMSMLQPIRSATKGPNTQVVELLLRFDAATIVGVVSDAAGRAIRSAEIAVRVIQYGPNGVEYVGPPRRVSSNADGRFRITGLPAGDVHYSASAPHHGWFESDVSLRSNGNNRINIRLPKSAAIEGVVVAKATGKAIGGAIVAAGTPGTLCYRLTKSNPDGSYLLDDLGEGATPIRAELERQVAATKITLLPGEIATWRAALETDDSGRVLSGIVLDQNQQPLAGWAIIVRQNDLPAISVTTGENGRFAIPVVQERGLDVRCFAPGRSLTAFADARQRSAAVGQDVILRTGQSTRSSIVGRVLGNDASGIAATINCWHHEHQEHARYAADDNGHFTIEDVPIGTVKLTIGYAGHVTHQADILNLQPAASIDLGTVQLALGGSLYGTVLGPAGTAPTTCSLKLLGATPGQPMEAVYADGFYRFSEVPAGRHTLIVQGETLAARSFPITIAAGVDVPCNIELQRGLHRRIRVQVPRNAGSQVTLFMRVEGEDTRWISSSPVQRDDTNLPGFALFDTWMNAGEYEAAAVTPQEYEARAKVSYVNDGAEPLIIHLAPR